MTEEQDHSPVSDRRSPSEWLDAGFSILIEHHPAGWSGRLQSLLLGGIYLVGILLWWFFLNGGDIQFTLHDWTEAGHRYAFLKDAVMTGQLPLHMPGNWALRGVTTRFMSVVDTNLSPQVLLLRFFDIGTFVVLNTLILYTLGFAGLLLLRRKYGLSPAVAGFLFLLLFFNGHVTSHLAVGHTHWAAYLLAPFILLSAFSIIEETSGGAWAAWTALLLFTLYLQGAFHLFVILLLFFALLVITVLEHYKSILLAGALAISASAVRILPTLVDYRKFDTGFFTGFPTTLQTFEGMVVLKPALRDFAYSSLPSTPLGWWEFDYYVGAVALFAIFSLLIFRPPKSNISVAPILAPAAVMTILSVGSVYGLIHRAQVPLLASQRVSSRLFIIPFLLMIGLAARRSQEVLNSRSLKPWQKGSTLGILLLIANDIWQHLKAWRVANMDRLFTPAQVDLARNVVVDRVDPTYEGLLALGGVITIAALAASFLLIARASESAQNEPA